MLLVQQKPKSLDRGRCVLVGHRPIAYAPPMIALRRAASACIMALFLVASEAAPQEATVTGRVVDSAGEPINGALVFLEPGRQNSLTDSSGAFVVGPVADGTYTLSYRVAGYAPRSFNIGLAVGARDVGAVVLQAGDDPSATLRGAVMDHITGMPLPNATVEVNGTLIAETDSTGVFDVAGLPIQWGGNQLRVLHRSFTDVELIEDFWVSNLSESFEFAVVLEIEPVDVPGVTVEAARSVPVRLQGFYERMETSTGVFLTREMIEEREPRRVNDLLAPMRFSRRSRAASSFGLAMDSECRVPLIFIDGQLIGDASRPVYIEPRLMPNIGQFLDPDQVEAMEVYEGGASVPTAFALLGSDCGVVVFWTR